MRIRLVVAAVAAAAACTSAPPPLPVAQPTRSGAVIASREALGEPLVALAEAAVVLADDLDTVRHERPRGTAVREALPTIRRDAAALRRAADRAQRAAADAPVAAAADLAAEAADDARAAADAADAEAAFLASLSAVDVRLARAAAAWDEPGSQSEQRARLGAQADALRALRTRAARIDPVPRACPALRDARVAWAQTVRARTQRLAANATSEGGATYDELRDAYRRQPLGEDPLRRDAADRACWRDASRVATAARTLQDRVADLRSLLR